MSARPRRMSALLAFAAASRARARRDRASALGLFALPVFVIGIVGVAMGGYSKPHFSLGVLDRADTPASRALLTRLGEDSMVNLRDYRDEALMRQAVFRGRLHGGLVLPEGWDGTADPILYATGSSVGGVVLRAVLDAALLPPDARDGARLEVLDGGPLAPPPIGFQYTAPSNLVLFVMINGMILAVGLLELRQRGIGRRLLATPSSTPSLLAALAIGPLQIIAVQAAFIVLSSWLAFGVDWGDALGVALLATALVALGVSFVLFAGTFFRTSQQAFSFGPWVGILLGMLGGCMWPLLVVPPAMQSVGRLFPSAWAMDGLLALSFEGAGWTDVVPAAAAIAALAAGLAGVGLWRLRREFAR